MPFYCLHSKSKRCTDLVFFLKKDVCTSETSRNSAFIQWDYFSLGWLVSPVFIFISNFVLSNLFSDPILFHSAPYDTDSRDRLKETAKYPLLVSKGRGVP